MRKKIALIALLPVFFPCFSGLAEKPAPVTALVVTAQNDPMKKEQISSGLSQLFKEAGIAFSITFANERCGDTPSALYRNGNRKVDFILSASCERHDEQEQSVSAEKIAPPVFLAGGDIPSDVLPETLIRLAPSREDNLRALAKKMEPLKDEAVFIIGSKKDLLFFKELKAFVVPSSNFSESVKKITEQYENKRKIHLITEQEPREAAKRLALLRKNGIKDDIFGSQVFKTKEFSYTAGRQKEGIPFLATEDPAFSLDATALLAEMRFDGRNPGNDALTAYAAGQIFVKMMKNKEKSVSDLSFKTILGLLRFDGKGYRADVPDGRFFVWSGNTIKTNVQDFEK